METNKKVQVIMLPASKSHLWNNISYNNGKIIDQSLFYNSNEIKEIINYKGLQIKPQHLYILSNDEIKEGDWCVKMSTNSVLFVDCEDNEKLANELSFNYKKIIATTDNFLGYVHQGAMSQRFFTLPQPSQGFIEKYVKMYTQGNPITEVLVEYQNRYEGETGPTRFLGCFPRINPKDNTITIHPVKDSWSREEVIELLREVHYLEKGFSKSQTKAILDKWIKENL
jgi:hypothetical protein